MSAENYANCPKCGGEETLEEYYEQGIGDYWQICKETGKPAYGIVYGSNCTECGFEHQFSHFETIEISDKQ